MNVLDENNKAPNCSSSSFEHVERHDSRHDESVFGDIQSLTSWSECVLQGHSNKSNVSMTSSESGSQDDSLLRDDSKSDNSSKPDNSPNPPASKNFKNGSGAHSNSLSNPLHTPRNDPHTSLPSCDTPDDLTFGSFVDLEYDKAVPAAAHCDDSNNCGNHGNSPSDCKERPAKPSDKKDKHYEEQHLLGARSEKVNKKVNVKNQASNSVSSKSDKNRHTTRSNNHSIKSHPSHQHDSYSPSPHSKNYPLLDNLDIAANTSTFGDPELPQGTHYLHTDYDTAPKSISSRPKFFQSLSSPSAYVQTPSAFVFTSGSQNPHQQRNHADHRLHSPKSSLAKDKTHIIDDTRARKISPSSQHQSTAYTRRSPFHSQPNMSSVARNTSSSGYKSSDHLDALKNIEHRLEQDNVKSKIKSVWNNLKYGWTFKSPKTTMLYDKPLYFIGKIYHKREGDASAEEEEQEFIKHFFSRLWLTYRSNFYPIPGTRLTSDCGWGCMLRSGQMMVAQCLVAHFLGPDWRLHNHQTQEEKAYYREIIRWFSEPVEEGPSDRSPFSLHHLVNFGRAHKKEPGEWFGPSSVAFIFRDAFERTSQSLPILNQLCLYVALDCTVYIDDLLEMCTRPNRSESMSHSTNQGHRGHMSTAGADGGGTRDGEAPSPLPWQRSLIIMIPMRLGGEALNAIYIPCVKKLLSHPSCMGIIGGKPKHSLYFMGFQDDKLIYLDPHYCRDAVDTRGKDFSIETYHCMTPRKLPITKMDPSCTVGFYIKDEEEWWAFVDTIKEVASPQHQASSASYPMFVFSESSHREAHEEMDDLSVDKGRVRVTHYVTDQAGRKKRTATVESEDFVLL